MVTKKSPIITQPPSRTRGVSSNGSGRPAGRAIIMMAAGTSQLTSDGISSTKNSSNAMMPFCQTISVVMSPNGLIAPPALAATTILTQLTATNRL